MKTVLCYGPEEITADKVYSMFSFEYNEEGSNAYEKESGIALNFMHFLANCASNGTLHIEYIYRVYKKTEQI